MEEDITLIKRNLDLPEFENRWDERSPDTPAGRNCNGEFLDNLTSPELIFRDADGKIIGKEVYLGKPRAPLTRYSVGHDLHLVQRRGPCTPFDGRPDPMDANGCARVLFKHKIFRESRRFLEVPDLDELSGTYRCSR